MHEYIAGYFVQKDQVYIIYEYIKLQTLCQKDPNIVLYKISLRYLSTTIIYNYPNMNILNGMKKPTNLSISISETPVWESPMSSASRSSSKSWFWFASINLSLTWAACRVVTRHSPAPQKNVPKNETTFCTGKWLTLENPCFRWEVFFSNMIAGVNFGWMRLDVPLVKVQKKICSNLEASSSSHSKQRCGGARTSMSMKKTRVMILGIHFFSKKSKWSKGKPFLFVVMGVFASLRIAIWYNYVQVCPTQLTQRRGFLRQF